MTNSPPTVCVVGGGPAGMVLALLLARAGVQVTVLEKHGDFLRDFRGDTVHASTLTLLDELGLGAQFAALPQRRVDTAEVVLDGGTARIADLRRLPGRHRHIALVPQWDLLEMLAGAGRREPTFELRRHAEVIDVLRDGRAACGVRYLDRTDGSEHDLHADLVVACDGRDSTVRRVTGLRPRELGVPMDVEWFRLPRRPHDPAGLVGRVSRGRFVAMIDRGEYWQCGYLVPKGGDAVLRSRPIGELGDELAELLPWLGERAHALTGWGDVKLLSVTLNRLRRWHFDGLLFIGDAAHAMSPVGGVGINLAIQDAVAAARFVGEVLRRGDVGRQALRPALRRVQRRRAWPAVLVQSVQRAAHRFVVGRVLHDVRVEPGSRRVPLPIRLLGRAPALQAVPARLVAVGPLPEHAPQWARRDTP